MGQFAMIDKYKVVTVDPRSDGILEGVVEKEIRALRGLRRACEPMNDLYALQNYQYTVPVLELLDIIKQHLPQDRVIRRQFNQYHARVKLNFGVHNKTDQQKFLPEIDRQWFEPIKEEVYHAWEAVGDERVRDQFDRLMQVILDPDFEPERPKGGNVYRGNLVEGWIDRIELARDAELARLRKGEQEIPILTQPFSITNVGPNDTYSITHYIDDSDMAPIIRRATWHLRRWAPKIREFDPGLALYLDTIAQDMTTKPSNSWRSDLGYLRSRGKIQLSIGPVEPYSDRVLSVNADGHGILTVRNDEATKQLDALKEIIADLEGNLPIDQKYRHTTPIKVGTLIFSDVIYMSGAAAAGPTPMAHSLPNPDEIQADETKNNNFFNIIQLKFKHNLVPILEHVVGASQAEKYSEDVRREAFQWFVVGHEMSHSFGRADEDPNKALGKHYHPIEEAKADASSMYNMEFLRDRGIVTEEVYQAAITTYVVGLFRSIRLGKRRAHGKSNMIQLKYLLDHEGLRLTSDRRYLEATDRFQDVLGALAAETVRIEGIGDRGAAKKFLDKYQQDTEIGEMILQRIDRAGVPIDIHVKYKMF